MSVFDSPSFNDGLTTDYGVSSSSWTTPETVPILSSPPKMTYKTFDTSLGASQGWDMLDVSPLYPNMSSPLAQAAANATSATGINVNLSNNTAPIKAATSDANSNAMMWLAAAGVLLAMAGFFKGKL